MAQETAIAALSERHRSKHPQMIEARAQSEFSHQTFLGAVRTAPARIEALCQRALDKEQRLREAVAEQEGDLLKLEALMIPYRALQREYDANRNLYADILKKLNESTVALEGRPAIFRMRDPAAEGMPLPYRARLYVIAGTLGGALLALGGICGSFLLDSSIKTVDEAEELLGLPVLTDIPLLRRIKKGEASLALLDRPDTPVAESFRTLRTALDLSGLVGHRTYLFSSAVSSEGKSLVVANMAAAFAQQGLTTLVIDADLRRPTIQSLLCPGTPARPGLAEYMLGEPLETTPTLLPNLNVLTAGRALGKPAELLEPDAFAELVGHLRDSYDRILIDTAPLNFVSDTFNLLKSADAVCLVARSYSTPRCAVQRAIELLARVKITPIGLVLSHLPSSLGLGYYHSYSAKFKYGNNATYATDAELALSDTSGASARPSEPPSEERGK